MAGTGTAICCSMCLIIIAMLLSKILVSVSIKDIDHHSAGILINSVRKKIEQGKVYLPGKYSTGLASKFITYPTSYKWIKSVVDNITEKVGKMNGYQFIAFNAAL